MPDLKTFIIKNRWIISLLLKNRKEGRMEDIENKEQQKKREEDLLFSKEDFENYKAKLQKEFQEKELTMKQELENEAKKASMSELELAKAELEEIKQKYQEKENECLIAKQKEETLALLDEAALDKAILDVVYVPLNMEETKTKIETLKSYMEKTKKDMLQNCMTTPLPMVSNEIEYDAFLDGFDSNEL